MKMINDLHHADTKDNAVPKLHWVARDAPPRRAVSAPAAAVPRRRHLSATARQRVAPLGRRSVPLVAPSRPAAGEGGRRARQLVAQPRAPICANSRATCGSDGGSVGALFVVGLEKGVPHSELGGTLGLATIDAITDASVVEANLVAGAPHAQ